MDLQGDAAASAPVLMVQPGWSCCLAERGAKVLGARVTLLLDGADARFAPGCLTWKFLRAQVLFLTAGGVRLEWCNCGAAQSTGVQRAFQNSPVAYLLPFESPLPISPRRAPGKCHFPKCAARPETLVG